MTPANSTRDVPVKAFQFGAQVQFGEPASDGGPVPVSLVARSGEAAYHWYWGNVVHDLAGMRPSKDVIPLDYCHNDNHVMGYADRFDIGGGDLVVSGAIVPYPENPEDKGAEVLHKSKNKVPYEGSIFFADEPVVVEEVSPGLSAQANGKTFPGPVTIIRQWVLRGVAICPYGTDMLTSFSAFAGDRKAKVSFTNKGPTMSLENPAATPATPPAGTVPATPPAGEVPPVDPKDEKKTEEKPPVADPAVPPVPVTELSAKSGKDFLTAFGTQGGVWFAEGKTFAEAQSLFTAKQSERVTALEAENHDLRNKLGIARGEKPLTFSAETPPGSKPPTGSKPAKNAAGLTEGQSKFAAGIKIPGK